MSTLRLARQQKSCHYRQPNGLQGCVPDDAFRQEVSISSFITPLSLPSRRPAAGNQLPRPQHQTLRLSHTLSSSNLIPNRDQSSGSIPLHPFERSRDSTPVPVPSATIARYALPFSLSGTRNNTCTRKLAYYPVLLEQSEAQLSPPLPPTRTVRSVGPLPRPAPAPQRSASEKLNARNRAL